MIDVAARETLSFLQRFLPGPPARLLQVGAGSGHVARALAAQGYEVSALDEIEGEFLHHQPSVPPDAVLFTGSLHRSQPIERTLDHAGAILARGGIILADEIAFDRVNVHTARWFYDLEAVLVAAEVITPPDPSHAAERRPLARWRLEHAFDPPLATGHDMLAAARERLDLVLVEEAPHLYRELAVRANDGPRPGVRANDGQQAGARPGRVLEVIFDLESRLVRERDIAAAGLRFAGKPLL